MIVEGNSRRINTVRARQNIQKSTDMRNIAKTLRLYPFVDKCRKTSLVSICVVTVLYVLTNLLLLAVFLIKSLGYNWYLHLIFLAILVVVYVFGGGFAYYKYYGQNDYFMYAYIALLSFVYCPLLKVVYVIANRLIPQNIAYYILCVVEMTLSTYLLTINLSLYCPQETDQRARLILHIIVFVVQTLGVLFSYAPFGGIYIFPTVPK